jgi:asparagine synthase (glutamine-hydrolysing)
VVELAWRLPYKAKMNRSTGKWILRRVLDRYVPRQLVDRPKMGVRSPYRRLATGAAAYWAADLLAPQALAASGIDPDRVRRYWAEHQAGTRNRGSPL